MVCVFKFNSVRRREGISKQNCIWFRDYWEGALAPRGSWTAVSQTFTICETNDDYKNVQGIWIYRYQKTGTIIPTELKSLNVTFLITRGDDKIKLLLSKRFRIPILRFRPKGYCLGVVAEVKSRASNPQSWLQCRSYCSFSVSKFTTLILHLITTTQNIYQYYTIILKHQIAYRRFWFWGGWCRGLSGAQVRRIF